MYQTDMPVRIGKYRLDKTLGIGSFSKVKLAHHELTGMKVAIKILDRNKIKSLDMEEKVRREIKILRTLKHPHIVRLFEVIETPTEIFLVLEFVATELFDYIVSRGRLPEDEARALFQHVISGVAFCHHHKIVHRDLKPENLLLSEDHNIKVADFGLSNVMLDGEFLRTSCGSPNYAAPEVIVGNLYAGPEVDVWSCGVILYALLCGTLPFDDESIPRLFRKIKSGSYTLPSHLPDGARSLIPKMLEINPIVRITIPQIRQHEWFRTRLPLYLTLSPGSQETIRSEELDQQIVQSITEINQPIIQNLTKQQIIMALTSDRTNTIRVTYDLLYDRKRKVERNEDARTLLESKKKALEVKPIVQDPSKSLAQVAFSPPPSPRSAPDSTVLTPEQVAKRLSESHKGVRDRPRAEYGSAPVHELENRMKSSMFNPHHRQRRSAAAGGAKGRRWYLGIQSKKEPVHVMVEVFLALNSLRCQWQYKSAQPYRLICRWKPSRLGLKPAKGNDEWVYLGLQLYKIQSNSETGIYLLDFQRIGGISCAFQFMNLCSCIIHSLKQSGQARASGKHARRKSGNKTIR